MVVFERVMASVPSHAVVDDDCRLPPAAVPRHRSFAMCKDPSPNAETNHFTLREMAIALRQLVVREGRKGDVTPCSADEASRIRPRYVDQSRVIVAMGDRILPSGAKRSAVRYTPDRKSRALQINAGVAQW
ncbi:hypothetical protein [Porphyrobacter sp. ULC335]|uniref:hypothetical protein n=1 Tax=Porphyrobacter sp. ULC335 TaxID=2854260 RepID=UPI00221EF2C1|nr:hypothetical protein [Porphyrobacter sp. ULC335]UYV16951.1 hypothetical protein KVF90_06565 [Porphyrobacter sp. ULC335]